MAPGFFQKIGSFFSDAAETMKDVIHTASKIAAPVAPILKAIPNPTANAIGTGLEWLGNLI